FHVAPARVPSPHRLTHFKPRESKLLPTFWRLILRLDRWSYPALKTAFGGIAMFMRLFTAFVISLFACGIVAAQHFSPANLHQPTITPQDSGTANGLIAVWPVNPQIVWA